MKRITYGSHLRLQGLGKRYGTNQVLSGIDLEVMPGEFVAIVGQSGCGKSTLLRLLAGLEKPTQGSVVLDGNLVRELGTKTRVMFQNARLFPWKRVIDNVGIGLFHQRKDWQKRAERMLQQVGLGEKQHEYPSFLSGGQRQRVALARALVSEPSMLLLDEPLSALDALTRLEMQRLVEELWQTQQFTSLLVTHDIPEAVLLGDRVILIERGRVVLDVSVSLSRPRHPNSPDFNAIVQQILERVMQKGIDLPTPSIVPEPVMTASGAVIQA